MSDYSFRVVIDRLDEILEAVRALKPAPDPIRETTNNVYQAFLREQEASGSLRFQLCVVTDENERLRAHVEEMQPKLGKQQDEIERLQKKVADDALTIGALKDENARLADAFASQQNDVLNELKRFREREDLVLGLRHAAEVLQYDHVDSMAEKLAELDRWAAAVRDFKVTP